MEFLKFVYRISPPGYPWVHSKNVCQVDLAIWPAEIERRLEYLL